MKQKLKEFWTWAKVHKHELAMAGFSFTVIVGIILSVKNKDLLMEAWAMLERKAKTASAPITVDPIIAESYVNTVEIVEQTRTYTLPQRPVDVSPHVRTMSGGKHHSPAKAEEAAKLGIVLLPNQTLVDSYRKYAA